MVNAMESIIAMDDAGRLVLPKAIRRTLNIPNRARFRVDTVGNRVELTVLDDTNTNLAKNKRGLLVVKATGKPYDAVQAVAEMRQERL
jgi:bifunctional DNA-binding transcriptional regulator/antitoxin component of YhaV-PrlF toxin-antitoxin module